MNQTFEERFREIPLWGPNGIVRAIAFVDAEDFERISRDRWFLHGEGYAMRNVWPRGSGATLMHRVVLKAARGTLIDHINRNRLDNRRANLRYADKSLNARNTEPNPYAGVRWHKGAQKWTAEPRICGERRYLGLFAERDDARAAVQFAVTEAYRGLL